MILLAILAWGLFAGWLANLILGGGSRPDQWGPLLVAGLLGSFVGGLIFNLIAGEGLEISSSGLIGTVLGAVVVLVIYRGVKAGR